MKTRWNPIMVGVLITKMPNVNAAKQALRAMGYPKTERSIIVKARSMGIKIPKPNIITVGEAERRSGYCRNKLLGAVLDLELQLKNAMTANASYKTSRYGLTKEEWDSVYNYLRDNPRPFLEYVLVRKRKPTKARITKTTVIKAVTATNVTDLKVASLEDEGLWFM